MIVYTLADFTQNLGLNLFFCRLLSAEPGMCRPGVRVDSIYGCFPGCRLNGGRALVTRRYDPARIARTYRILAEYGLCARLTLTNTLATRDDLEDPYVDEILSQGAAAGAWAIVANDLVAGFARERYGMKTVLSTTVAPAQAGAFNAACERHDLVVANYSVHKDAAFLGALEHPERVEIMVNEYCAKDCPRRADHYRHNAQDQLDGHLSSFDCPHEKPDFFKHEPGHPVLFTADEVRAVHERYGISNFKIVGRGTPFASNLEALCHYLVRPECQGQVRQAVLRSVAS
jgi:hypothetical protein